MALDWSPHLHEVVSALCAEQRRRWSAGERVLVEEYVQQVPQLAANREALLDVIYAEICLRRDRDETVPLHEYTARFPELCDELTSLFAVERAMDSPGLAQVLGITGPRDSTITHAGEPAESDRVWIALATSPVLGQIPPEVINQLVDGAHIRELAPGETLIEQGAAANSVFLVLDGEVDVSLCDEDGSSHPISHLGGDTLLGEIGPLTGRPRTARVVAATPIQAVEIPADSVRKACLDYPALTSVFFDLIGERLGDRQHDILCGTELAGYRFEQRLGRGGMGVVYRAVDLERGRDVALKMLRHHLVLNSQFVKRFQQEAAILRALDHPRIIKYYGEFTALRTFFIVTEYVSGESLQDVLIGRGRLTEAELRAVVGQLAEALAYAHSRQVVHRDLKPGNVLVGHDGHVRLMDFGLSRSLESAGMSSAAHIIGTPRYMAPEQLSGSHVDHRADYFALGCMMYEMLTGRPQCDATTFPGVIHQQMHWRLPEHRDIGVPLSDEFYSILRGALELDREKRRLDLQQLASWAAPFRSEHAEA